MRLRTAALSALTFCLLSACVEQPDGSWEFGATSVQPLDTQGFLAGRGYFLNADSVASDCLVPPNYVAGQSLVITPRRAAFTGGQEVTFALSKVESSQDIQDRLNISASVSAKFLVAGGDAKFSFSEETKTSDTSVTLIASLVVRNAAWTVPPGVQMSTEAKDLLRTRDLARFRQRCGDEFLQSYTTGGEFYAVIDIATSSKEEKQAISSSIKGNYFTISGSVDFSKELEKITKNSSTTVRSYQVGGAGIDTAPCRTVACVAERLTSFTTAVAAKPVVVSAQTASYSVLELPADAVSPLDKSVALDVQKDINFQRNATRDLLTKFLEVQSRPERYVLKAPHATLAQITAAVSTLNGNLAALDTALKGCARDPDTCAMPSRSSISVKVPPSAPTRRPPSVLRSYKAPSDFLEAKVYDDTCLGAPYVLPTRSNYDGLPGIAFSFGPGLVASAIPGVDTVSLQPVSAPDRFFGVTLSQQGCGARAFLLPTPAATNVVAREGATFYLEPGLNGAPNTYSLRLYWTTDSQPPCPGPKSCARDGRNRSQDTYLTYVTDSFIGINAVAADADAAQKDEATWYVEAP